MSDQNTITAREAAENAKKAVEATNALTSTVGSLSRASGPASLALSTLAVVLEDMVMRLSWPQELAFANASLSNALKAMKRPGNDSVSAQLETLADVQTVIKKVTRDIEKQIEEKYRTAMLDAGDRITGTANPILGDKLARSRTQSERELLDALRPALSESQRLDGQLRLSQFNISPQLEQDFRSRLERQWYEGDGNGVRLDFSEAGLSEPIDRFNLSMGLAIGNVGQFDSSLGALTLNVENLGEASEEITPIISGVLGDQAQGYDDLSRNITASEFSLIKVGVAAGELAETNAEVHSSFESGVTAASQLVEAVQGVSEEAQNLEGGLNLVSEVIEVSSERFERLGEAAEAGTETATEGVEALEGALAEVGETAELASAQTQQSLSDIDIAAQQAGQEIQQIFSGVQGDIVGALDGAFRDALDGNLQGFKDFGKTIKGIFKDVFSSIKDTFQNLIATIAKQKIFEPLVGNVFKAFGLSDISTIFGKGGGGATSLLGTASGATNGAKLLQGGLSAPLFPNFATSGLGEFFGLSTALDSSALEAAGIFSGEVGRLPTALGKQFNQVASIGNAVGGIIGSTLAGLVFTPRQGPGDDIGGFIGGTAGAVIGGPVGAAVGSFLGTALGGLFGSRPSDKLQGSTIDLMSGNVDTFGFEGKKFSQQNRDAADSFVESVKVFTNGLTEITGGTLAAFSGGSHDVSFQTGNRSGVQMSFGTDRRQTFGSVEQAWGYTVDFIIEKMRDIEPHVETALQNIDFTGNFEDAFAKLEFAAGFDDMIEAMNSGSRDAADAFSAGLKAEADETLAFIREFKETTEEVFRVQEEAIATVSNQTFDFLSDFGISIGQLPQEILDQINGTVNDNNGLTETGEAFDQVNIQAQQAAEATRALVKSLFTVAEAEEPVSETQAAVELLKAKFEAFNEVFEEVGITANEATTLLNDSLKSMGEAFTRNLKTLLNDVSGRGFLNDIHSIIAQNKQLNLDADAVGTGHDLISDILDEQLGSILDSIFGSAESLDAAQASFDHIKKTFENYPEIVAAAAGALAAFEMDLDFEETREKLIASLGEEIDALEEQVRLQETLKSNWSSIISGLQSARFRLLTDPNISRLTAEERAQFTLDELEAAFAAAQGGDVDAAAKVSELALAAAEANKAFFASSEDFARINERIEFILRNTETFAQTQVGLLQSILDANLAQIEVLQGQVTTANNAPLPSEGPSALERLDALNIKYADALEAFDGSQDEFYQTPEFGSFKNQVIDLVGQLNDIGRLTSDYGYLIQGAGANTPLGHAQDNIAQAIAAQLDKLGFNTDGSIKSFATGGVTDGLAIIHPGELLYTGPPARVINAGESAGVMARSGDLVTELRSTRRAIESLNGTVSAANDDQMGGLNRMAMRLGSIESGLELRAARA